ncbi:vWA domain-containing protein [Vulcaniibacterium gelatinicum]|uniref:vWA domain-containing protein n=1 Tax=Vulcaniibacterium gelatinicum TaxID=2598725 RepID=UPI0011CB5F83|nr:VWA domain-containing protein [Vulcaniibacterium gelatinicum]
MNALQSALGLSSLAFAWPWLLAALPLPWLARRGLPPRRSAEAALRVPYGARLHGIAAARRTAGGGARLAALWLAWALLCVAAARPQQLGVPLAPPQQGRDLMLAVDLSGSMGEEDMELGGRVVDRLTAAKAVIADFLERRAGDRVGLLVFGERAHLLTPLTADRATVQAQLQATAVGLAGRATAIGDAIGLAVKRLREQRAGQRVLILLTDGVNTAGLLTPDKAAAIAADEDVRVHTIAFGGEGGGLSLFGFQLPFGGEEIDEATLQRIAERTGGRFFRARDTASLAGIYAEIDRLEPIARPGQTVRPRIERYPWPLGAAIVCGLFAVAAGRRRR